MSYQNYEQPARTSQHSDFESHFSGLKIVRIFLKIVNNIGLEDQLLSFFQKL